MEKLGLREGEVPQWEVIQTYSCDKLYPYLDQNGSLTELNALCQQLALLGEQQTAVVEGLVKIEFEHGSRPVPMPRLIDMAYSTDCCHLVEGVTDDAELQEFETYTFKQLSSGMQSRLAFSIASLVQPEILILDEVLSVGDGAFQEKSARTMKSIIQKGAATILVSHSLDQIRSLCTKILWLHKGRQIEFGDDVQGICNRYQEFLNGS